MSRKVVLSIEGNIGAGKSTVLDCLREICQGATVVQEPVLEWQELQTDEKRGLLESFYADQKTYAFQLQMFALLTRFQAIHECTQFNDIVVAERSILSDSCVFAHTLQKNGCLTTSESAILQRWSGYFASLLPESILIYIKTPVDVCMDRIKQRAREGEENITVAYLSQLEAEHQVMVDNFFGHIIELDGRKCPLELAQELVEIISNLEHD